MATVTCPNCKEEVVDIHQAISEYINHFFEGVESAEKREILMIMAGNAFFNHLYGLEKGFERVKNRTSNESSGI